MAICSTLLEELGLQCDFNKFHTDSLLFRLLIRFNFLMAALLTSNVGGVISSRFSTAGTFSARVTPRNSPSF